MINQQSLIFYFDDIDYLAKGNHSQQDAYRVLKKFNVMESLAEFTPVLVGTVPLQINIAQSDLDIVCSYTHQQDIIETANTHFGNYPGFVIKKMLIKGKETLLVNFMLETWPIELFAQKVPVQQQAGYQHMIVEHCLLMQYGNALKEKVLDLKNKGFKTEPAFAIALDLEGDPYLSLLNKYADVLKAHMLPHSEIKSIN